MPLPFAELDVVFVAHPLPNGTQVLMPRAVRPRSCVRLDGTEKIAYASRSEAGRGCPKHQVTYRCKQCREWHRATKRKTAERRETWPAAAWVAARRRAA
ncbi:MAG: hypothetical protein ABR508_11265 [Candidatus Baltobacteraceae bacterium]